MLNIGEKLHITLKVDGQDLSAPNLFEELHLCEGMNMMMPTGRLVLKDLTSMLASPEKALADGNKVEIIVSKSFKDNKTSTRSYRLFGVKENNTANGAQVELTLMLNSPKFVSASAIESYEGNSDQVLEQMAAKVGLTYNGPKKFNGRSTNDKQVWLNIGKSRALFAFDLSRRAWMDDHSAMSLAVTSYSELRYRNWIDVVGTQLDKVQYSFVHNAIPPQNGKIQILVIDSQAGSSSGAMTSWMNYGTTRVQPSLSGEPLVLDKQEVKLNGNYLALNAEVKAEVGNSRFDYSPIDAGNAHINNERAVYQNTKILALFSERMSILVEDVTEVQLLDPVLYRQANTDLTAPVKSSDIYIVIGKTISVQNMQYVERIELARMSLTMQGTTTLTAPESNTPSQKSLIPDVVLVPQSGVQARIAPITANVSATTAAIKNSTSNMNSLAGGIAGKLTAVVAAAQALIASFAGPIAGQAAKLTALNGATTSLLASYTQGIAIGGVSLGAVTSLYNNLSGVPNAAKSSLLSSGGVINSIGSQVSALSSMKPASALMGQLDSMIPFPLKLLGPYKDFKANTLSLDKKLAEHSTQVATKWNTGVSMAKNAPIPVLDKAARGTQTVFAMESVLNNQSAKIADVQKTVGKQMGHDSSTPNWVTAADLKTTVNVVKNITDTMNTLTTHATRLTKG